MKLASTQYSLSTKTFELYISGCKEHPCNGCHAPELWDEIGNELDYIKLNKKIVSNLDIIDNLMICGGEPLEKPKEEIVELIKFLQQYKKPIWLYTRFEYDEVDSDILNELNYIKCGKYDKNLLGNNIQYGIKLASANQKIYEVKKNG